MVSLGLNRPKNFLGYTLAVAESNTQAEVDELLDEYSIVRAYSDAQSGAQELDLIQANGANGQFTVTPLGERVVEFAQKEYGGTVEGLSQLGELYGSPKRFKTAQPEWQELLHTILLQKSTIAELIEYLREFTTHRTATETTALPLPILFAELYRHDKQFAKDMFLRPDVTDSLVPLSLPTKDILSKADLSHEFYDPSLYYGPTIHHLKSVLYHAGVLTAPGTNSTNLDPESEKFDWELEDEFMEIMHQSRAELSSNPSHDAPTPERTQVTTTRVNRDTQQVTELKELYEYQCQVCGRQLQKNDTDYYAEGHHLQPLGDGHDGPDIKSNIIIVCPNCHADCDHGMVHIHPETYEITHTYNDTVDGETLTIADPHSPHPRYLTYRNNHIANQ